MGLETANYITQLVATNPVIGDPVKEGDDHLRLIKSVLQNTFPNASAALYFPTSLAQQTASITPQATDASKIYPISASAAPRSVTLPTAPPDGTEFTIIKTDSTTNQVTLSPPGGVLINGLASITLDYEFEAVRVIYLSTYAGWLALRSPQGNPFSYLQVLPVLNGGTGVDTVYEAFDAFSPARVDVASAATPDLDAAQSSYVRITGVVTITGFTLTAGRKRWVVFGGILTLTHSGSLILPSGANITTAAGDTALFVAESGTVRCVHYQRADGSAIVAETFFVTNRGYDEYTANAALSTIPFDDTIPQVGEGTQILAVNDIAVQDTSHRVRVSFQGFFSVASAVGAMFTAALFVDGAANAVAASASSSFDNDTMHSIVLEFEHAPGDTDPHDYTIRVGASTGSSRMNGTTSARRLGGVARSTLVVQEVIIA